MATPLITEDDGRFAAALKRETDADGAHPKAAELPRVNCNPGSERRAAAALRKRLRALLLPLNIAAQRKID